MTEPETDDRRELLRSEILRFISPSDRLARLAALGFDETVQAEARRINNGADLITRLTELGYC